MSLHHTIRVFDYDYRNILDRLVQKHYEPVIILTKLDKKYFDDNKITTSNIRRFGFDMQKLMNHHTCMYCITPANKVSEVETGLLESGMAVRSTLAIPIIQKHPHSKKLKKDIMYAVYATMCGRGRDIDYNKLNTCKCCTYKETQFWNLFVGDEIEAMRMMIRLSSEHRDEVFDPFMGNGDTGVAAIRTDRHYFGTEPDGGQFRITKDRLDCLGE